MSIIRRVLCRIFGHNFPFGPPPYCPVKCQRCGYVCEWKS